jgi:chromosome segregation and condensation protein ScpB
MGRRPKGEIEFDRDLRGEPEDFRRREFMSRIEVALFTSSQPVKREVLASLIGDDSNLDDLIAWIGEEIAVRPFEIARVAGGYQYRTRVGYAAVVYAVRGGASQVIKLSKTEQLVLTVIAYFQPITRMQLSEFFAKPVNRDAIASLRNFGLVTQGPRLPTPGAPPTYVTTEQFLIHHGLDSLRDLPDFDRLEEAGLLGKAPMPEELRHMFRLTDDADAGRDEEEADETGDDAMAVAE